MSRNRGGFYWDTIKLISDEYCRDPLPWVVAYSGGKDSSAVLKLVTTAISLLPNPTKTIHVIYCDTGVEIPVVAQMVDSVLEDMARELLNSRLPIRVTRAMPKLYDRFFVKVIGRGFPPPTNRFRWCTDRLRIDPIARLLCQIAPGPRTILLGVRRAESTERARLLG